MSDELPVGLSTAKSIWIKHIKRSQEFSGSDRDYCRENGLSFSTFGTYKRKLGFVKKSKPKEKSPVFKKISVREASGIDSKSPEWIARFLKEFLK